MSEPTTPAPAAIVLRVPGTPAPQGSKSPFVVWPKGSAKCPTCGNRFGRPRAVITEGKADSPQRRKLTAWRSAVTAAAHDAGCGAAPLAGPVRVRVIFYLERPKSYPAWRWLPWTKPDLDKLCRSTLDALTAGHVFGDDAQVVELAARKVYALGRPTGALIRVEPLADQEARQGNAWSLTGGAPPQLR